MKEEKQNKKDKKEQNQGISIGNLGFDNDDFEEKGEDSPTPEKERKKNISLNEKGKKKKWKKPVREHSKTSMDFRKNSVLWVMMAVFLFLITVLYSLMVIDPDGLSQKASEQYTRETTLSAKRGIIYDRNMNVLATNYTVYTVFISPRDIETEIQHKLVVDGLVDILGVDREKVEERTKKNTRYEVIAKEVDEEKATELRTYISKVLARTRSHENPRGIDLSVIINLEEETKRYYPYGSLASNIIGFVSGSENSKDLVGVYGAEATYENVLKGVNGKIVKAADGRGNDLAYKYETYIEPQNGKNLVLSIDITIQAMLEKYLEEAYYDNNYPPEGVAGIIMNVNTGEILASAKYPSFDLNNPKTLNEFYQKQYDALPEDERTSEKFVEYLMKQWQDKIAMGTYEPGSTFKIFTAATALEEGVVSLNDSLNCPGYITVGGTRINCHKTSGHGHQSFAQTLQNSCNPAFVTWGQEIGKQTFLEYYESFGYMDKTGSDMYAESATIYFETTKSQFETVELATYSFGQTFKTTMLQQIRGVSVVANGGTLVTPHVGVGICDVDGNMTETYEYESTLQVISDGTSKTILSILEEGSQMGTTKNATVAGYSIAAKTGTSQKINERNQYEAIHGEGSGKNLFYIGSCVAFAPAEDPQIAILVAIDEPRGKDSYGNPVFYGGVIAAPVVSKVLTEVLPYMEIPRSDENAPVNEKVENYETLSVVSAKEKIEAAGFACQVIGTGDTVVSQSPEAGAYMIKDGKVFLYTDDSEVEYVTVPSLKNYSPAKVKKSLDKLGLNYSYGGAYTGAGTPRAVSQTLSEGQKVPKGTVVGIEFFYDGIIG